MTVMVTESDSLGFSFPPVQPVSKRAVMVKMIENERQILFTVASPFFLCGPHAPPYSEIVCPVEKYSN